MFSEAWWVGTKEENPEEKRLELPPALAAAAVHEAFDYGYGSGAHADDAAAAPLRRKPSSGGAAAAASQQPAGGGDDESQQPMTQPSSQRPRRAVAAAGRRYADGSDGGSDDDREGGSDSDGSGLVVLGRSKGRGGSQGGAKRCVWAGGLVGRG